MPWADNDGTSLLPQFTFESEQSLGLYRSGASAVGVSYGQFQVPAGTALLPGLAISSESSLGFFRSGASAIGLSYGQFQHPAGTALLPSMTFSSESSLGFFVSATSVVALSYGTFQAAGGRFTSVLSASTASVGRFSAIAVAGDNTITSAHRFRVQGGTVNANNLALALFTNNSAAGVGMGIGFVSLNASSAEIEYARINAPSASAVAGSEQGVLIFYTNQSGSLLEAGRMTQYGQYGAPAGAAATPSYAWSTETKLGFYRSGISTIAVSQGTFNLATNAIRLSMRTLATSAVTASAVNTNVAKDEVVFTIGGASGASLIISSGGTAWIFNSAASAILA